MIFYRKTSKFGFRVSGWVLAKSKYLRDFLEISYCVGTKARTKAGRFTTCGEEKLCKKRRKSTNVLSKIVSSKIVTHHGLVITRFSVQLQQLFKRTSEVSLVTKQNYNTRGAFAILFLICSDLLNCLRSLSNMVITTESVAKTASKSFSLSNSSQKSPFFAVLMYTLYGHHRYFKFKRKYQRYGPCFQIGNNVIW